MKTKDELRREMKLRLAACEPEPASGIIADAISVTRAWQEARLICAFLPLPTEPQIAPLWADDDGPAFCFPRIRGERIDLVRIEDRALIARADWRMAECDALPAVEVKEVDLILVPGLAFTRDGRRLGRGGGYYDRLLARCHALPLGVCFHAQILDDLPTELHDQRVSLVMTELGIA